MPDIKVKDVAKGTVKAIDKSATAAQRMKNAYIRTKEKAEHSAAPQEGSPEEYAAGRVSSGLDSAQKAVREFDRQGRKGVKTTKENISKAKDYFEKRAVNQPKKQARRKAAESIRRTTGNAKKTIKTVDRGGKTIKQTAKSTAKGTVKTARKTVKTAERTAKTTIKTTQQAAKAAQKTAQATARAARAAAHAARAAAKAAAVTAKAVAKAIALAVKAIIAGTKALIAAIAAGGWIAVLVIIIICLIAMIIGSCFGIFFSSEDSGSGVTMQGVVQEINTEYQDNLDETKASHTYDVLEMSGSRAVWKEVLAVYAVKTTNDPDNAQEVATMDDGKKQILKDIFWEMNAISSSTDTKTETVIQESDDGNGNIVETEVNVTQTYLYITVSHKTADEMAAQYGFSEDQKKQLAELLADENNSLWTSVLYGITGGDGEIVSVALSQIGNIGGEPYWSWYGFPGALNGARVSFRGARTNAGISKTVLSRSSRAVFKALIGSRSAGFGRITATSRVPVTSSFLTGMMKADRTGYPTMWVSSKRSRMAASTR